MSHPNPTFDFDFDEVKIEAVHMDGKNPTRDTIKWKPKPGSRKDKIEEELELLGTVIAIGLLFYTVTVGAWHGILVPLWNLLNL